MAEQTEVLLYPCSMAHFSVLNRDTIFWISKADLCDSDYFAVNRLFVRNYNVTDTGSGF